MSHVFVSHSSDNRELAQELAAFLEAKGARVWIAPRDVRPGTDYSEQLQLAIENCVAFVVLVTEMANKSPYVRAETEMAFSNHKPIFPVRVTDLQPAPGLAFFLKIRHWTDAFGTFKNDNLDRLVRELQVLTGFSAAEPASPAAATAPPPLSSPPQAAAAQPLAAMTPGPPPAALPANAEEEERWRAAIGPNADHYLGRWRQMAEKNRIYSWNWPACLFNLFWFAWRKMWLPMAGMAVIYVLMIVIPAANPAAGKAMLLLGIGASFVTGSFGNHLYRQQTAKLVATTSGPDRAATLEALRKHGGTSVPALVISLGIVALVTLVQVAFTAVALQQEGQLEGNQTDLFGPEVPAATGDPLQDGVSGETDMNAAAPADDKPEF